MNRKGAYKSKSTQLNNNMNRSPFCDRLYKNNDLDDSDDNPMGQGFPGFPDLSGLLKDEKKKVFRDHNHIYFRCEVTMERVNKLCNLIDEYNREQDALKAEFTSAIIIPKPIYLHITSMGGDLLGGFLAYDYIRNSKIPVYTVSEGYTVSSGANMFMAGHKRFMTENSYILVHQLSMTRDISNDTFHDMIDNTVNIVDFMSKSYAIYLNNIRHHRENVPTHDILTKEKLENHMLHDIYWNYETCLRFGIVDGIYTNYADTDVKDVNDIIQSETNTFTPPKVYSLQELKPSKVIIDKIKQNIETNKQNDAMNMIKSYLGTKSTTDTVNGLVNLANSTKRKVDDEVIDDISVSEEIPEINHYNTRRSTRQTKKRKTVVKK